MTIRPLRCDEIASLVHLCGEHAAFEKAAYAPERQECAFATGNDK